MSEYRLAHINGRWAVSNDERGHREAVVRFGHEADELIAATWTVAVGRSDGTTGPRHEAASWGDAISRAIDFVTPLA